MSGNHGFGANVEHPGRLRLFLAPQVTVGVATALVLALIYLRWTPLSPDLAAQVARAQVSRQIGSSSWWTGWFAGLSLPNYSVVAPSWMAALGVRATGVLAAVLGTLGSAWMLRASIRPRAGAFAFAVSGAADLADGRITFVVGAALAVWSINALTERRTVLLLLLGLASYFASPLAALFLGIVFVATAAVDRSRRRDAALGAGAILVLAVAMALLFPGTGTMPFGVAGAVVPALCCVAVGLCCPQPSVRVVAGLTLCATIICTFVPGAIGSNITRLAWIAAAPVVIAFARLPKRWLIAVVVLLAAWPLTDTAIQLQSSRNPSTQAAFYQPVGAAISAQRAELAATGQRVEVVDTVNHWGSVYLADQALARGWDRQVDDADNPIFYRPGALTAASYRQWLTSLAVGWVALPAAPLDFASVAEGKLVRAGLSYLSLSWSNANWRLYRVIGAAPLATGARVDAVDADAITLSTTGPAQVQLRVRWSPYLDAVDPTTRRSVPACVSDDNGWLALYLPRAETVLLTSDFTVANRLRESDADCVQDLSAGAT
jgi:hypothetical protein